MAESPAAVEDVHGEPIEGTALQAGPAPLPRRYDVEKEEEEEETA